MKRLMLLYFLSALFCTLISQETAWCFNVSPGRIEIAVEPSQVYRDTLVVKNTDTTPLVITVRVEDWHAAVQGVEKDTSARFDWLTIHPLQLELEKGETREIDFSVTVPKGARGELNAMIFVEGRPKSVQEGSITINTSMGVPIYVAVKGTERFAAEVEDLQVVDMSPVRLLVKIRNSGNVHIRPTGTIDIKDGTKDIMTLPLNEYNYPILPDSSRTLEINTEKRLEPASYTADVKMGCADKVYRKTVILQMNKGR